MGKKCRNCQNELARLSALRCPLTRDNTFTLIRSCGKDMYKVEKSKEDT